MRERGYFLSVPAEPDVDDGVPLVDPLVVELLSPLVAEPDVAGEALVPVDEGPPLLVLLPSTPSLLIVS